MAENVSGKPADETEDWLLNFEADCDGQLFVHADSKGLGLLIRELERLAAGARSGKHDHSHLFSREWGDGDLSSLETGTREGTKVIHHVKIFGWPESSPYSPANRGGPR